jgi:predicted nucleic acid-binding protein
VNALVVDTSSWISFFSGKNIPELELGLREGRIYVPPIVVAELMSGTADTSEQNKLSDFLRELPLFEADLSHWLRVGLLRAKTKSQKLKLSTPDAHIAQCTLDLAGYLLTEDKVFEQLGKLVPLRLL